MPTHSCLCPMLPALPSKCASVAQKSCPGQHGHPRKPRATEEHTPNRMQPVPPFLVLPVSSYPPQERADTFHLACFWITSNHSRGQGRRKEEEMERREKRR